MDFSFKEITFGLLELESCLLEFLEDDLNVFEMLLLILLKIMMLSRYAITKSPQSCKTIEISCWKYAGTCAKPKGTALNSYLPKGVRNAVLALESLSKQCSNNHFVNHVWWIFFHHASLHTFHLFLAQGLRTIYLVYLLVYPPFVCLAEVHWFFWNQCTFYVLRVHQVQISWVPSWLGWPRADAFSDDSRTFQCLDFLLNLAVMLKRQSVRVLTNGRTVPHINMHSNQICTSNILAA